MHYEVLKHSLVSCGININRVSGTVQPYSTFPWFKSASLSILIIRLFLVVSSHRSPVMKVRCHMSYVKINVRLNSALSYLQLSVIHGHVVVWTYLIQLFHQHYLTSFFLQETVEMRAKCQVDQTQDVIIGI